MLRRLIVNIANQFDKTLRQKGAMSEVVQSDKAVNETVQSAAKRVAAETDDVSQNKCIKLDDEATLSTQAERKPKLKRKKIALLTVYSGKGYYGVQIQITGHKTIESELVKALHSSNLIDQSCADDMSKMWFQRASRTDKGVSAADLPEPERLINEHLPESIKVLAVKKTTKMFDAKNACSYRTYEYMAPTFAFAPIEQLTTESYRIDEETRAKINNVMQNFKGTHNFHNFTSKRKHYDKSSTRYMMSFEAGKPFVMDDLEFIVITVRGQSFMLHQIRKMIGLTMAVVKGFATLETIELCWGPNKVDIPKAPGLGLLLDKLHYDGYNKRYGSDGVHEAIEWDEYKDEIEKFKMEQIYKDIVKTEKEEKCMLEWLQSLSIHSYQMYIDPPKSTQLDSNDDGGSQAKLRERINLNKDGIPVDKDGNLLDMDVLLGKTIEKKTQQDVDSDHTKSLEPPNTKPVPAEDVINASQEKNDELNSSSQTNKEIISTTSESNSVKHAGTSNS